MTYREVSLILKKKHEVVLSANAICKRLRYANYPPRRGPTVYSNADLKLKIEDLRLTWIQTHDRYFEEYGYSCSKVISNVFTTILPNNRQRLGIWDKVMQIMREVDPSGVAFRKRRRIKRKVYYSNGPNYIWHVDGYEKLKPYGFPIHGCIDGFSRKILWLEVGPSNNDPAIVGRYYMQCVSSLQGCPTVLQSDPGTENITMGALQCLFRHNGEDILSGIHSYRVVRSVFNQRIESWWSMMRRHQMEWWITFFKDLEAFGGFRRGNENDIYSIRYCFMPLLQNDLNTLVEQWNNPSISYNRHAACPHGKPSVLYTLPESKGFNDCIYPVAEEDIDFGFSQCKIPTRSGSNEVDRKASVVFCRRGWHDALVWQDDISQYFDHSGSQL